MIRRKEFEVFQSTHSQNVNIEILTTLMKNLKFFFEKDCDANKLVWVSQLMIRNSSILMKHCQAEKSFTFSLTQFLSLTLNYLADTMNEVSSNESKGSHWRVLEIFLNAQGWQKNVEIQRADAILGSIFVILSGKGRSAKCFTQFTFEAKIVF